MNVDVARWSDHWAFDGYAPWLQRLAQAPSWEASALSSILRTTVVFSAQVGKLKAGLDASDIDGSYADCCAKGVVPTRPDNLHDLLNALVWARFPLAKMALSQRQVALAKARTSSSSSSSSKEERVRTREQDAAAMVDEGGMILGPTRRAIFGHAALEDAIVDRPLRPFLIHVDDDDLDAGLARLLTDPQPLPRVRERHSVLADQR